MRVEKIDLENFPTSESAQNMLATVTPGFYDKSYVGKWLYQVIGLEFDEAERLIAEELPLQFFPETATWGLMYHEVKWGLPVRGYLSYDERRKLIYEKRDQRAPMTPYKMEALVRSATGFDLRVSDIHDMLHEYPVDHPNKFVAVFFGTGNVDISTAIALVGRIKQSHTTFRAVHVVGSAAGKCYVAPTPGGLYCTMSARVRGKIPPQSGRVAAFAGAAAAGVYAQTGAKLRLEDR